MKKIILSGCLCLIFTNCANAMQMAPRRIEGKIRLGTIVEQMPDLYRSGSLDQALFFSLLHISDKALTEASRQKIVTTQESLDEAYLAMEIPPRIKFLHDPNEQERVTQIVQAIVERFNSELLGFSPATSDIFFSDTPIQQFEDLCAMYDTEELSKLENVKSLKEFLSKYQGIDSYPNVLLLLRLIK